MENIYNTLVKTDNQNILKKEKSLVLPLLIALLSIALLVTAASMLSNYLSLTLVMLSLVGIVIGIVLCFKAKGAERYDFFYAITGEKLNKQQICYASDDAGAVRDCLSAQNYARMQSVKKQFQSSHCLEIWATQTGEFMVAQMLRYGSYRFEPDSEVAFLQGNAAQSIHTFVKSK